jgi:DNA-binding NtrC family response regulator
MNNPTHPPDPFDSFVTRDPLVLHSLARVRSWSQSPLGVLFTGEAGVGKSLVARLLHVVSSSSHSPFVICTAVEPKGPANQWATLDQEGATVVLDGLEHWSLEAQAALVERLESRTGAPVRVIGISRLTESRLRLESRVHPLLAPYWASRVIEIPPLRARPDDLAPLVEGMLRRAGRGSVELDASTWRSLATHGWSDNVRELRRTIDAALTQAVGDRIEPRHLPLDRLVPPSLEALATQPFEAMRREVDSWYLRRLLHETSDNISEAARRSGCSRKVLRERLRRHGLYRTGWTIVAPSVVAPSFAQEGVRRPLAAVASRGAEAVERPRLVGVMAAEERVRPWIVVPRVRAPARLRAVA